MGLPHQIEGDLQDGPALALGVAFGRPCAGITSIVLVTTWGGPEYVRGSTVIMELTALGFVAALFVKEVALRGAGPETPAKTERKDAVAETV